MLCRNNRQIAQLGHNGYGIAGKAFFEALSRWSRVECNAGAGKVSTRHIHTQPPRRQEAKAKAEFQSLHQPQHLPSVRGWNAKIGLRKIMRSVPHSVVVLTTRGSANPALTDESTPQISDALQYHGMTLSSLTTLSLDPMPLVTFNIQFPSKTLSALTATRFFMLHILASNAEGKGIAAAFVKGKSGTSDGNWHADAFEEVVEKGLASLAVDEVRAVSSEQLPRLEGKGVIATLMCSVLSDRERAGGGLLRFGDHVLVVARIKRTYGSAGLGRPDEWDVGSGEGQTGLAYARRNYGRFVEMGKDREGKDGKSDNGKGEDSKGQDEKGNDENEQVETAVKD